MACEDPYVSLLQKQFNAVPLRTPDSRFAPYTVLVRKNKSKGSFTSHGHLKDLLVNQVDLPTLKQATVPDFEGKKTKELSLGFGLEILGDFLVAEKTIADVKTTFKNTKNITLQFKNIKRNYGEDIQLGRTLGGLKLDMSNLFLKSVDYIWIINQSFTSDEFEISADNSNTVGLGAEVPIPGHAIGVPISVKPKFELETKDLTSSKLSFKSGEPQTFAFTCLRFKVQEDGSLCHWKTVTKDSTQDLSEPVSALIQEEPLLSWRSDVTAVDDPGCPPKFALLIGINDYYHISGLSGCINDVKLMEETLVNKFGFRTENIIRLYGEKDSQRPPNRDNIRAAFNELMAKAQQHQGAIIVIHYSGHGSYQFSATKPTHQDETIVPCDSGRKVDDGGKNPTEPESTDIPDTEIRNFLQELSAYTSHIAIIFDCCHSQSMTRGRSRQVQPDSRLCPATENARGTKVSSSEWTKLNDNAVVIAACEYNDVAQETGVGQESFGVLTYYLTQELNSVTNPATTTYQEVFHRVKTAIKKAFFKQIPNIEGNSTFSLFSMQTRTLTPYAIVTSHNGQQITLNHGAVHGVTVGSKYKLYINAALQQGDAICTAKITNVTSITATAEILATNTNKNTNQAIDLIGFQAVEVEHFGSDMRIQVCIPNVEQDKWKELCNDPLIDISDDPQKANLQVIHDNSNDIAVLNNLGEPVLPIKQFTSEGVRETIENLKKYARYHFGLSLNNDLSPLQHQISFKLYRSTDKTNWQLTDSTFYDDDYLKVEVEQPSDKEVLYFTLLGFDEMGEIRQLYPLMKGDAEPFLKKNSLPLTGEGQLRRDFPNPNNDLIAYAPVQCALKLFVTKDKANYSPLLQGGYRAGSKSPTEEILSKLMATRTFHCKPSDWTILTKFYQIVPKTTIQVCIQHHVNFGECIVVAGAIPSLGNWDAENGVKLTWNPDDKWQGSLVLPKADYVAVEWKFAILHSNGTPPTWESMPNRLYSSENLKNGQYVFKWNNEDYRSFVKKSSEVKAKRPIDDFLNPNYRCVDTTNLTIDNIPPTYSRFAPPPQIAEEEMEQFLPKVTREPKLDKVFIVIIGESASGHEERYFKRDIALAKLYTRLFTRTHKEVEKTELHINQSSSFPIQQAVYLSNYSLELFIEVHNVTAINVQEILTKVFALPVTHINIMYGGHGKEHSGNMLLKDREEFTYEQFTTIYKDASAKRGYDIYGELLMNCCYSHIWQNTWYPLTEALGGVQKKNFRINGTTTEEDPLAPIEGDLKDKILKGISLLLGQIDRYNADDLLQELKQLMGEIGK